MAAAEHAPTAMCRTSDGGQIEISSTGMDLLRGLLAMAIDHYRRRMPDLSAPDRLRARDHIRNMRALLLAFGGSDEIA